MLGAAAILMHAKKCLTVNSMSITACRIGARARARARARANSSHRQRGSGVVQLGVIALLNSQLGQQVDGGWGIHRLVHVCQVLHYWER